MRSNKTLFYHISIFVIAQLAWLALLGIWIYWYVTNYIVFSEVGEEVSQQLVYDITNVGPFVGGIILLVGISFSMSLIFRHLNVQLKITRLYDNFIANITHELKSPLSSIQLYLETLKSRNVPEDKQEEFLDLMMKDTGRLNYLINSILEISSFDPKKQKKRFKVYRAEELFKRMVEESAEQFRLRGDSFSFTTECGENKIFADADGLKIILNNLFDNAIKYSVKKLKIDIKLVCSSKKLLLEFRDNGIGIPENEHKKIFRKFYRINNKETPSVKGTGLGLFWVREIIKSHNGKITVENLEEGTTFKIELPIYKG